MTEELTMTGMGAMLRESRDALGKLLEIMTDQQRQLAELRKKVAMLEKLTPMQQKELGALIRGRADAVARAYGITGEKKLAAAIRRAVRTETGARSAREIARCDYPVVTELVRDWEDWDVISKLMREE